MLTQDNTKLRKETNRAFEYGKKMFEKGNTPEQKEKGMMEVVKGLRTLALWIQRENNPQMKAKLKQFYNNHVEKVEKMKKYLDDFKDKQDEPDQGGQTMLKKGKGGKKGEQKRRDKEEKDMNDAIMKNIVAEKPNVKWTDVAGLEGAKKALQEAVILPIRFPECFVGNRKPWKGILLYGPPGTGKTFLAKACATETEGTFFSISAAALISKFVGQSEKNIKALFKQAAKMKPSIIFIDEIDSMCSARDDSGSGNESSNKVKTEFLVQMQGVNSDTDNVLVLGATNLPWQLDPAIRRRFEKRIYIPLPGITARRYLIKIHAKKNKAFLSEQELDQLAQMTDGFSGSDISIFVNDAVFEPVRIAQSAKFFRPVQVGGEQKWAPCGQYDPGAKQMGLYDLPQGGLMVPDVTAQHFFNAAKNVKASVGKDQLGEYVKWTKEFGQEGN